MLNKKVCGKVEPTLEELKGYQDNTEGDEDIMTDNEVNVKGH